MPNSISKSFGSRREAEDSAVARQSEATTTRMIWKWSNTDFRPQIDAYILSFPEPVQAILREIRRTVTQAAPEATEVISYRMPALRQKGMLVYYAAFKHHIGLYPPVRGDAALVEAAAPYAGDKGNLRFPYEQPIPYGLIERIVRYRVQQEPETARKK